MSTLNPHTTAHASDAARRGLGHPGYGWIDAQPAVQPQTRSLEACDLGRTDTVVASVLINQISTFGMKGAREGLT